MGVAHGAIAQWNAITHVSIYTLSTRCRSGSLQFFTTCMMKLHLEQVPLVLHYLHLDQSVHMQCLQKVPLLAGHNGCRLE